MSNLERAAQLAEEHWQYIGGLLTAHDIDKDIYLACHFHYKTAFIHGYKHALEDSI